MNEDIKYLSHALILLERRIPSESLTSFAQSVEEYKTIARALTIAERIVAEDIVYEDEI